MASEVEAFNVIPCCYTHHYGDIHKIIGSLVYRNEFDWHWQWREKFLILDLAQNLSLSSSCIQRLVFTNMDIFMVRFVMSLWRILYVLFEIYHLILSHSGNLNV